MRVAESARKHRVSDADMHHAIRHYLRVIDDGEVAMFIGPGRSRTVLEVGVVRRPPDHPRDGRAQDVLAVTSRKGETMTKTSIRKHLTDEQARDRPEHLDPSTAQVRNRSDVVDIEAAVAARHDADAAITTAVARARDAGVTWVEIGAALGITHQGAIKRYGGARLAS